MKKTIDEIENEWKSYLRRSRLSYVTSSLLKFYDILEDMIPVKGKTSSSGYSSYYELHFRNRRKPKITYKIFYSDYRKELLFKKQQQRVCSFYLNDRTGYFFRKKQHMESIRYIMEDLIAITIDLTRELTRKDEKNE